MEDLFIKILNMSITASYFVVALIILRAVFRKIPRWLSCALWGLVGLRLVLPFSFDSILSLIPSSETIPTSIIYESSPYITSGIGIVDGAAEHILYRVATANPGDSINPLQILLFVASVLWLSGIAAMLVYTLISYVLIRRKTAENIKTEQGIYICDGIGSPFILGIIKPKIFIPSATPEADIPLIISHEKAHLKRLDHLWKPLGFLILSVYWFNPLMWEAYILLCRDIEAACDEKVLKNKGADIKKSYSEALINCSAQRKLITACPLAFGETDVKSRIKNILSYKKPTLWIIIAALAVSFTLSVCFMTNPDGMRIDDITGYDGIFSDVEKIQIFIGNGHIYTTEDTRPELSEIKKVRIDKTPVNKSFSPAFRIELDDETAINIDETFSFLFLHKTDDVMLQSITTYSIKNPEVLKNLFSMSNYVTGMEGIYVSVGEIEKTESGLNFNVTWHNERDTDVEYGEMYSLERFTETGYYEDVPFPENFVFLLPAYLLKAGTTAEKTYFCPMELSEGEYRFKTTFTDGDGKSYEAKTVFFIGESNIAKPRLSLDDVIALSEKGKDLSWSDFEKYAFVETGSGLYIRSYSIDEVFSLAIGGSGTDTEPMYIYLCAPDGGGGEFIDIRQDDVEAFIEKNKDNPIPDQYLSFSCLRFPVDTTGENLNKITQFGAFMPVNYNRIKTYPTVKIDSTRKFNEFYEYFSDTMDFSKLNDSEEISLSQLKESWFHEGSSYFDEHTLFLIYVTAPNTLNRFDVRYLQIYEDTLHININERTYETVLLEEQTPTGWLIVIEASKGYTENISRINAYIGSTENLPEPQLTHIFTQKTENNGFGSSFQLYDDGTFMLFVSPYSSYVEYGTFRYEGDLLILTSEDEAYRYVFESNSDYAVYKANESIVHNFFSPDSVTDGTVFNLQ